MKPGHDTPIRIVRKKRRHKGHHGGAWKVAFADFTTAMMALFLVLWLVTQSSDVKASIAGYFQDPLGRAHEFGNSFIQGQGAQAANVRPLSEEQLLDQSMDKLQMLGEQIRRKLNESPHAHALAGQVDVRVTREGLRIDLVDDSTGTFFQSGGAIPSENGRDLLMLLGTELASLPYPVMVEGHTDAQPYVGTDGYGNFELSTDRANSARRIFAAAGLPASQVIQVRGFADHDLRRPDQPLAPQNRRVTVTMLARADAEGTR